MLWLVYNNLIDMKTINVIQKHVSKFNKASKKQIFRHLSQADLAQICSYKVLKLVLRPVEGTYRAFNSITTETMGIKGSTVFMRKPSCRYTRKSTFFAYNDVRQMRFSRIATWQYMRINMVSILSQSEDPCTPWSQLWCQCRELIPGEYWSDICKWCIFP